MADVAALILAAGAATRFGSLKQLARLGDRTLLDAVVETASRELAPVLAVVPAGLAVPPAVVPVINGRPELGLSRSLRLGIAAIPPEIDAAVILLGDQPTLRASTVRRILAARGDRPIVAAATDGVAGPPVLLERRAFDAVDRLSGDIGLRDVIRTDPALSRLVEVEAHAPDIDTPADLDKLTEPCPGCGARLVPMPDGPTHPYIGASPACWTAYGELLAREFQDRTYGRIHRHTVDVYTAQHPGTDGDRQRQSVALHLIGLCHWLEHGLDAMSLNAITQRLAAQRRAWPWLSPPASYEMTLLDALAATNGEEHARIVRRWAESVWASWSEHHELIRRWSAEALD